MASSNRQSGTTLLEVLAAAIVVFIVLATAMVVYFLSVLQGAREIVDSEVKAISRSVEHAIRGAARANLAADRRSFFADVEGVRIFVPLPRPGQPAVDLPDYDEDFDANTHGPGFDAGDIDWDQNGVLNAPAFALPEPVNLRANGADDDGDGVPDDGPQDPEGMSETFLPLSGRSQAYDRLESDGDTAIDDVARVLFPVGLLALVEDGSFQENLPLAPGNWNYLPGVGTRWVVLPPLDEDLNGDGFVSTSVPHLPTTHLEAAMVRNAVPPFPGAYYPDTFEDLDGNARITAQPVAAVVELFDVNGDTNDDYNEYAEDFNCNGFLDVPVKGQVPGLAYHHGYYGGAWGAWLFPADPLTQGLMQAPPPGPATPIAEPYQAANFAYASQIDQSRTFGYKMRVQRVEGGGGSSMGFGGIERAVYRVTLTFYADYTRAVEQFRQGFPPDPVRVQSFEVIVE